MPTTLKSPSNRDIVKLLTLHHEETSRRLDGVEAQVKYTNGQVRVLNDWKTAQEAIEQYKKTQPTNTSVKVENNTPTWTLRDILAGLGILATAIALAVAQLTGNK